MTQQNPFIDLPNLDLETIRGTSFKYHFIFKEDGVPVNLTGATGEMKWKRSNLSQKMLLWMRGSEVTYGGFSGEFSANEGFAGVGSILLNVDKNGVSGTTGGILLRIGSTTSEAFPSIDGVYDIELTMPSGKKKKAARGRLRVNPSVYYRPGFSSVYQINPTSATGGTLGGVSSFAISANRSTAAWFATTDSDWIVLGNTSGFGSQSINYTLLENPDTEERTGIISVAGLTFTVIQLAGETCSYEISPSSSSGGTLGGSSSFSVITNRQSCPWEAVSNANWITLTSGITGSGNRTVNYSFSTNEDTTERTGTVSVAGLTFTFNQIANETCSYIISPSFQNRGATNGSSSFSIQTSRQSCPWEAISNANWIVVTGSVLGVGNGTVNYSHASNTDGIERTGTISIGGLTFTVSQTAEPCSYQLSSSSAIGGSFGGSSSFNVSTNSQICQWQAISNADWLTVTGLSGVRSGNGTVTYSFAANPQTVQRVGTITVAGQVFTFTQNASEACSYQIIPTSASGASLGGSSAFSIQTSRESCPWQAVSNANWITLTGNVVGSGNGTVNYSLAANSATSIRTGTVSIAGLTFTISQDAASESQEEGVGSGGGFEPPEPPPNGIVENTLAPVGDPEHIAYGNNTIARWAEPLYEVYTTSTQIPVFAYHITGINRLEFSLNNGDIRTVSELSYNSSLGATCYNLNINPAELPDNEMNELRVTAYPNTGIPQILQGEVKGPFAETNIKFGHHSLFFATNHGGSLRMPHYYVNGVCGDNVNSGLTSTAPKLTIESALMASGASNASEPGRVDGTTIHLMDNGGVTVDYYLGTPGVTVFGDNANLVLNIKRNVTIKPFNNSKVVIRGSGNTFGLKLCNYRFENLRFDIDARNSLNPFSFQKIKNNIFTNPANGITYELESASSAVHFHLKNCYYTPNFQKDVDWSFFESTFIPPETSDPNVFYPKMSKRADETSNQFKTRHVKFWYGIGGWTGNPYYGTSSDEESVTYEFAGGNPFNPNWHVAGVFDGCTLERLGSFMKSSGQIYLTRNTHSSKAHMDVWRDPLCLVNCSHEKVTGHPLNARYTLTDDVVGLGFSGEGLRARDHADIMQIYTGTSSRNIVIYGCRAIYYRTQGPFLTSGVEKSSTYEHPPIPLDATPSDYEPYWTQYRDAESKMIRDLVIDNCVFLKDEDKGGMSLMVGGNLSGNYIIKDTIIGRSNTTGGVFKYGFSTIEDEHTGKFLNSPLRPCLIINSVNGGMTSQGNNRCLLFGAHRDPWNAAGNPNYFISPEIKSGFTLGRVIYDFRGAKPNPIVVPGITLQLP